MSEHLHKVDDLFKQALSDHEEAPPSSVWESLDRQLDKKTTTNIYRKYKRLKLVATASLMLAGVLATYTIYTSAFNDVLTGKKETPLTPHNRNTAPASNKQQNDVAANTNDKLAASQQMQQYNDRDVATQNKPVTEKINKQSPSVQSSNRFVKVGNNLPATQLTSRHHEVTNNTEDVAMNASSVNASNTQNENNSSVLNSPASKAKNNVVENNAAYKNYNATNALAMPQSAAQSDATVPSKFNFDNAAHTPSVKTELQPQAANVISAKQGTAAKKSKLSYSVFFSPDIVSSRVVNDNKVFKEDDKHEIERTEKSGFSSTIGALVNYKYANNWSIQSGITFSTTIKKMEKKGIYARPDNRGTVRYKFNCSSGYSYIDVKSGNNTPSSGDSLYALNSTNTLQYIGVPLALQYAFTKGRWSIAPSLGASANILTKGKIETVIATGTANERNRIREIHSLKPVYFSGIAGVSFGYNVSKRLAVLLSPRARFALSSINKQGPVKTYQNSFGIAGGFNITL